MKILKKTAGDRLLLEMRGDFDAFAAEPFATYMETLAAEGARRVELDMTRVRFLSSRAATALLRARQAFAELGGELRIAHISGVVGWTLATLGVDHLLLDVRQAA